MYRVWTKDEYSDNWTSQVAMTDEEVKNLILAVAKEGKDVLLTRDVSFHLNIQLNVEKEPVESAKEKYRKAVAEPLKEDKVIEVEPSEVKSTKNSGD